MVDESSAGPQHEVSYLIGSFMADQLVRVYQRFDGDLLAAVVLATVASHNLKRYYEEVARHSPEGFNALVEANAHVEKMRHCNANSVSDATGIPRETVRRKVHALVDKGYLIVGERGQLTIDPDIGRQFVAFEAETSRAFENCAREVARARAVSGVA